MYLNQKLTSFVLITLLILTGCSQVIQNYPTSDFNPEDLCNKISNDGKREACKENIGEKPEKTFADCDTISNPSMKYECIAYVNAKNPNITICNEIPSEIWRDYCLISVAVDLEDVEMCNQLNEKNGYRTKCYIDIAKKTKNPQLCEDVENNAQENCIASVAINSTDVELCNQLTSLKENCKSEISVLTNDLDLCLESGENTCIIKIAASRGDESLCNYYQQDSCYFAVARDAGKPEVCKKVNKSNYDSCLAESAKGILNPYLCEEISDINQKDVCYYNMVCG